MKLFTKYNRINIFITILTFIIGSIGFYFVLYFVLLRQLDETLRGEQQEVVDYIKSHDQLPVIQNTKHQWITIEPANRNLDMGVINSILSFNQKDNEPEKIRQLSFTVIAGKQLYLVTVNKSETETEDLLQLIIIVTIGMIGFILLTNYLINRKLINRLWYPFYQTIGRIKEYQLAIQQPLQLTKEPIDEINLLNDSLNKMTTRIHQDYHSLKSFTENASHEMQTPLAVIRSKVEALLQDLDGNEKSILQLLSIEEATQKLSRLHQSLLLLTRLENKQFSLNETVNLNQILFHKLEERQELITAKKIQVQLISRDISFAFHQHLAEMLINNLLNNAIRYSPENAQIIISLTEEVLSVKNTATRGPLNKDKIFQRFYKEAPAADSTGLGLAIIKEICILAGFNITYEYIHQQHDFTIHFT